ncbi:Glu-tRNA(Gln) amidotransferase subunit GatD [Nanoarchaeota archaeon]
MAKEGDKVKVFTKDKEYEGILMPEADNSVIVKLKNGYNVGIIKKNVKKIEVIEKFIESKDKKEEVKHKKGLKKITILHTGGTIASKVDYRTGGVVSKFSPSELLDKFPELREIANIDSKLISQMFSEDMRFVHYKKMLKAIKEEINKGADGIILTHGTDTISYTAVALALGLEGLNVPVIIVGAQRSSDRGSSDAGMNLICAAKFIAKTDFAEVAICMHENMSDENCLILPACKTRKMHTSRRDAFKPINVEPFARVNYKSSKVEFLRKDYVVREEGRELVVKDKFEEKVGFIKCHPNMIPAQFEFFKGYKGLVIEGTGLGQAPVGVPNDDCKIHKKILDVIDKLTHAGCIVVMTSQCIYGRVQMHVYSNAIDLVNVGVIPGEDMFAETAFIKLAWVLGNYGDGEAAELMRNNLRGEISERMEIQEEFI